LPLDVQSLRRNAWLSAALLCALLLILPGLTWLLAPRAGGFTPPPASKPVRAAPMVAPEATPTPVETSTPTPARFQPKPVVEEPQADTAPVTGVVLDPDGKPVKDAIVGCDDRNKELSTKTDEEGRFKLAPEAAGCLAVSNHPDFGPSERVTLRAGENTIRLGKSGGIEGQVIDEKGSPISPYVIAVESFTKSGDGAEGPAVSRQARTVQDQTGSFLLEKLAPGRYILTASADGRPPVHSEPIEVEAGRTTRGVRITLPRGATLTGKVLDAETRKPVVGAVIALDAATSTNANAIMPAHTDESGAYTLDGVPGGPFSIRVSHERYRTKIVPGLLTRGAPTLQQDVELSPRGDGGPGDTELAGIGAVLVPQPKGVIVSWLIPGGPAQEAGLRPGDVIARIDGIDAQNLTLNDCIQRLRGPEGSRVLVSVRRDGSGTIEASITRKILVQK